MGFEPQIRDIIEGMPSTKQNLFFTATWPKEVEAMARDYLNNPVHVAIGDQGQLNANKAITQTIKVVNLLDKQEHLEELLVRFYLFSW